MPMSSHHIQILPRIARKINFAVNEEMKSNRIPGLSIAIMHEGKIVFAKGYGFSNLEDKKKVTPSTIFWIGSLTKQFTSALVMRLVEQRKLRLNEPLINAWPNAPQPWAHITLHQLLSHTSGIPNYTEQKWLLSNMSHRLDRQKMYNQLAKEPLDFSPGEKYEYSNTNYVVLGDVLEFQTHKPFLEQIENQIARPFALKSLGVMRTPEENAEVAQGYSLGPDDLFVKASVINPTVPFAAGNLESTPSDLLRWTFDLQTHFLKKSTLTKMYKKTPTRTGMSNYGLGWVIGRFHGKQMIGHDGEINGFCSTLIRLPKPGYAVAIFANRDAVNLDSLALRFLKILLHIKDPKSTVDPTPLVTDHIKKALCDALHNKFDSSLISKDLFELVYNQSQNGLPITSPEISKMKLVSSDLTSRVRTYLIRTSQGALFIKCLLDGSDKLIGAQLKPD